LTTNARAFSRGRARLLRHVRYAVVQFAEVALPRKVFADALDLITGLRGPQAETASA